MTEEWKEVIGYSDYEVSNLGKVRTWKNPGNHKEKKSNTYKELSQWKTNGYWAVTLVDQERKKKNLTVHRLVAFHFLETVEGKKLVCHIDDNKTNNSVSNLRYGTHSENGKDAVRNKKLFSGESHPGSKLSNADVDTIRHLVLSLGKTHREVAEIFNVARTTVTGIINSRRQ